MEFVVVPLVSMLVAAVTLVSGFGLGTVLMPVFAIFFPVEVAIAATGVVHFVNNLFKLGLVGKHADRDVVVRFGLPAVVAAFAGAWLMTRLASIPPVYDYAIGPVHAHITWLKLATGVLLAILATLELMPWYQLVAFPRKALPIGGALSGFIGGVSGMQGALRAPFLLKAGLSKEQFVGTANVLSTMVDFTRLGVYALGLTALSKVNDYAVLQDNHLLILVLIACAAGVIGSLAGRRFLAGVSLRGVRTVVAILLFVSAAALLAGLV